MHSAVRANVRDRRRQFLRNHRFSDFESTRMLRAILHNGRYTLFFQIVAVPQCE